MTVSILDAMAEAFAPLGLKIFGHIVLGDDDRALDAVDARAHTAVMIGNAGPDMWRAFDTDRSSDPALQSHDHPMDTWTKNVVQKALNSLESRAIQVVYPSDGPPYVPFQKWAVRTGVFFPSPLGPLVHRTYGPWAGFRAAVLLEQALPAPQAAPQASLEASLETSPCATCADRPCLTTCPVSAFDGTAYDVPSCMGHLKGPEGAACLGGGCLARRACPYGTAYHHLPDQAAFHMGRFFDARRAAGQG